MVLVRIVEPSDCTHCGLAGAATFRNTRREAMESRALTSREKGGAVAATAELLRQGTGVWGPGSTKSFRICVALVYVRVALMCATVSRDMGAGLSDTWSILTYTAVNPFCNS